MLELGHPIHTFDADTLSDHHVIVRMATEGETLRTLDGTERSLLTSDILVADASGPVALAGVMGGANTEVSEDTTNILVEAAHWDPPSILFTSHRLGLRSEASARFERGVDPKPVGPRRSPGYRTDRGDSRRESPRITDRRVSDGSDSVERRSFSQRCQSSSGRAIRILMRRVAFSLAWASTSSEPEVIRP